MAPKRDLMVRTTLSVTMVILISKLIGFIRDRLMANYFGATMVSDAYTSAYSLFYLPILLFSSCITSTLIPLYVEARNQKGRRTANRFASNTLMIFSAMALIVSALMMVFAEPLVHLVYPGFAADKVAVTVDLSKIMYPSLIFYVIATVLTSILNAREHFVAAQLTGFPLSAALIVAAVFFSRDYGIYAQAWGVVAAGALQIVIMLPALRREFRFSPTINFQDKRFRRLLILALPAILSMGVNELNHMIDHALASTFVDGHLTAMSNAYKLITFLLGIFIVPLTTIMFSKMSEKVAESGKKGVAALIRESMEMIMLVILPIVGIAAVEAQDIIKIAYGGGAYDPQSVAITGVIFVFYVIGVPFFGLRDMLNRAFHSMQDTRTPMLVAVGTMAVNVVLNLILSRVMGVNGLALATSIAGLSGCTLMLMLLHKRLGHMGMRRSLEEMLKILLAAAAATAVGALMNLVLPTFMAFFRFALIGVVSMAAYGAVCMMLRVKRLRQLTGMLKGKRA